MSRASITSGMRGAPSVVSQTFSATNLTGMDTAMEGTIATQALVPPGPTLQQLSVMASIYVMLSTVGGPQHPDYLQYLQLAVHYYTKMLHVCGHGLEARRRARAARAKARARRRRNSSETVNTYECAVAACLSICACAIVDDDSASAGGASDIPRVSFPDGDGFSGWVGWSLPESVIEYVGSTQQSKISVSLAASACGRRDAPLRKTRR
jgi:hypothetical protein